MQNDYSPILVTVPSPWRAIGIGACIASWLTLIGMAWLVFISTTPPEDVVIANFFVAAISSPIFFLFCIPVFIGHYPSWVIRILGRKHILRFIADCEKHVGNQRQEKAKLSAPSSWLKDRRIFWLGFVLCCFVIGLIAGLSA